jgi:predicted GNAT family acetyltransferase
MSLLRDLPALGRLEMDVDGHVVFADYRQVDGALVIDHVEAPPMLRGAGAAGRLMEALAAHARLSGQTVIPICGYAAAWLKRHPEHIDIVG